MNFLICVILAFSDIFHIFLGTFCRFHLTAFIIVYSVAMAVRVNAWHNESSRTVQGITYPNAFLDLVHLPHRAAIEKLDFVVHAIYEWFVKNWFTER